MPKSATARNKAKVIELVDSPYANHKLLTTHEVAKLLQMDASTISKWIDKGQLKAFRTPGAHRRVIVRDLKAFCVQFEMPMPPELE